MNDETRIVLDCNAFLQALAAPGGPAGACIQLAMEGKVRLFVSSEVLRELSEVTAGPNVIAKLQLDSDRVLEFMDSITIAATVLEDVAEVFKYERNPDNAHYVNLALAANARFIVT